MKFDVRNGSNAVPLWRYDPKITRSRTNRGIALYGDKVIVSTNDMRMIAIKKDSGELAWEVNAAAPTDPATGTPSPRTQGFTGAPLAVKTAGGKELIIQGESTGGQLGTRSWIGAFEVGTGKLAWRTFTIPAPGEPGSETWKDNHNAWRVGGGGVWQTASYDPATNLLYVGTGDAYPSFDPQFRPGDNLYTASTLALDADTGKIRWYFQETRTSIGTSTRRAPRCSTTSPSMASNARSSRTSRATASSTRSTGPTVSSCGPTSTRKR